ncbi:hypothetical protein AVT98_gp24 [Sulfolobales virus YNP1]|uniref:hypothetical protein n=1 Tax=Sulfolobales virus YNP1 TaxID=1732179 RepID=UPI000706676F|nr:hypothetical protein AVT98_gp24 [Sulfolobales virus YNP1]ALG97116.1 hypothetical protein [Sulfolobales virus YNP1]
MPLGVQAVQSFLTFYVNVMDYGTVLMLQNQSNVLTLYEIPSSFSSVPSFQGVQTTGKALEAVENVTLKGGEVALVHEYGVSGFSTQNFLYQQVNVPGIVTYSNSTTSYYSSSTLSVTPDYGYQLQFTPWFGIQNQPVDSVESTSWKVLPYWENGELVMNDTANIINQYIAWRYSPVSNTINITIHVTSFPNSSNTGNAGFGVYSPNIGDQSNDNNNGFYALIVDFHGNTIWFHPPKSGYEKLYTSLPQPNPDFPFTFSAILTENSAGNITVSTVYINSTAYTVNFNTPFPWSQIGYIGIRPGAGNLYYVSYFGVSPAPYGCVKQFVNNVESTSWKIYPYWENGELILNETGASNPGQYIGWRYSPISNVINVTMHVTSWHYASGNPAIDIASPNLGALPTDNDLDGWYGIQISWYEGLSFFVYPNGSYFSFSTPNANCPYPFTFTIILTESSNGYVNLQSIYINSTLYTMNKILPMPWQNIGIIAIRLGAPGTYAFYVS